MPESSAALRHLQRVTAIDCTTHLAENAETFQKIHPTTEFRVTEKSPFESELSPTLGVIEDKLTELNNHRLKPVG